MSEVEERDATARAELVAKAVGTWTSQLVDLGGRNTLLFYRDLKKGTLDLGEANRELFAGLLAGKVVRLSRLLSESLAVEQVPARARTIHNKAQELFEERGLQTLFVAFGLATWQAPGRSVPAAPVLLCAARLAPVGAAQEEFDLSLTGELEVNPTLLQALSGEFACAFDEGELLAQIEGAIDTTDELDSVYAWLERHAPAVPGFSIGKRVVLGTFSYAKLPMVKDLEGSIDQLIAHELVSAMAGDATARQALRDHHARAEASLSDPDTVPLADEYLVLDADASQNYAINSVLGGASLIIKGPPGTGKSQTIANLIATLLSRGQRVLFVAEKRAAIDAVFHRLAERGLSDLMLDLHDGGGSRRKVAQTLASALAAAGRVPLTDHTEQMRQVEQHRAALNQHAKAYGAERPPWGISVHDAQAGLLGIVRSAHTELRLRGVALERFDVATYREATDALLRFTGLGGHTLAESGSAWAASPISSVEQAQAAAAVIDRLRRHALPAIRDAFSRAETETGLGAPSNIADTHIRLELWTDTMELLGLFRPELFQQDLAALTLDMAPAASGGVSRIVAGFTSGTYKAARATLRQLARSSILDRALRDGVVAAADIQERWRGLEGAGHPSAPSDLSVIAETTAQAERELAELEQLSGRTGLATWPAVQLDGLIERLRSDQTTLSRLSEVHRLRGLLSRMELDELVSELGRRQLSTELCGPALRYLWLSSILEHLQLADPDIASFDGRDHDRTVARYRAGDAEHIETTAARLRRQHAERVTQIRDEFPDQAALVQHQAGLRRKHMPLRQLFHDAPDVLLALKPCWAMSPLVVSQMLPSNEPYFDVVIFDEASQIKPADAIPAILRGKRLVIAGDDRQLPPTDFFASRTIDDENDDSDEPALAVSGAFESILDAMMALLPFRVLEWHYRSRDERLIAFSNTYLYDRMLTTFPGIAGEECLDHVLVPHRTGAVGQENSASAEVTAVVRLILEHAERWPEQSLGVIAMGIKHANRVDETLRQALRDRPDLQAYFDEAEEERFFVKNLERVQGDERDRIILTIGYGKSAEGNLLYRFGPINNQGGERRLNVAITRAKQRLTLVSSFGSQDMDPNRATSEGVKLLRLYLQYVESQGRTLGDAAFEKPALNPFEIDVRDRLTAAGIPLVAQFGSSGYWIDFVAQHPTNPGQFVLAIECDGARYHSSPTARDRDRLRQDQLERLGWRFHRIWSADWFHHPEREVGRALEAYQAALARGPAIQPIPTASPSTVPTNGVAAEATASRSLPRPAIRPGLPITEYSLTQLVQAIRWIESDTLLRTREEITAEVMRELGFERRGSRITTAIEQAIVEVRSSAVIERGPNPSSSV